MALPSNFLASLTAPSVPEVIDWFLEKTKGNEKTGVGVWEWVKEITPVDLYCYLKARFGMPNGLQNVWRNDDSDNLIHWEWCLFCPQGSISILGLNFRTEVWVSGDFDVEDADIFDLAKFIKEDFANYGRQISEVRKSLELWTEFVNPYMRLRRSIETLQRELDSLKLRPETEAIPDITDVQSFSAEAWQTVATRYSKGLGICFGIRSMLPIMAEAYVNLLLFVLMRPDVKNDDRLRENTIRQPIDVRIKSLHMTCVGFERKPDYSHDACKAYHTLVNERNDLLHGNVVPEKLKFNEVHFSGKVPIFKSYRSLWERAVGVEIGAVGLHRLQHEMETVDNLIGYLKSCLNDEMRGSIEIISNKRELGINQKNGRVGILFPDHLVDIRAAYASGKSPVRRAV
ncbi:MAG TPA: hypothetical protein VF503_26995 [Sphingobium sp.]|uniref:hypothetical protein n=1 Tax=Sphingobium sp. TaxID=1912891 RepID=UPI002ED018C0